ncbi:MAG: twin-arginine translocase TatA/TatE family subunit [Kiritimatiellae bacterium]|nr:twin-arginine translocase TatA/TatE family subunit [Kiritimatiellia bacterium]
MAYFPSVAFLTGSVGAGEWVVLFVVVLIVVGPKRLPEIARKLGRTMEMFRRAADEFKDQLMNMDQETPSSSLPPTPVVPPDTPVPPDTSDAYDNPYPDASDYPGNESQDESWSSDSGSGTPDSTMPPDDGSAPETHTEDRA